LILDATASSRPTCGYAEGANASEGNGGFAGWRRIGANAPYLVGGLALTENSELRTSRSLFCGAANDSLSGRGCVETGTP